MRPVALGHHRYQWLHVAAFVRPTSGETVWHLATGLSKPFLEAPLAGFARETGAGRERHVVLVLDDAGWHGPEGPATPGGDRPGVPAALQPRAAAGRAPLSPEPQPAEHPWPPVDEPVVDRHFATLAGLEAVAAERCRRLDAAAIERCRRLDAAAIEPHTDFHWWPRPTTPG